MSPAPNNRRKSRDERRPNDYYPTPFAVAQRALALLPAPRAGAVVLDPGAGTGVWGYAAKLVWPDCGVLGVELPGVMPAIGYDVWVAQDYITWARHQAEEWVDVVIGNPPYGELAEPFIWSSLHLLKHDGWLMFLLPLEFLGGQARGAGLFREAPPMRVVVSSRRIDFTGGSGDMRNHALFIWRKGWHGEPAIGWLDYLTEAEQLRLWQSKETNAEEHMTCRTF